MKKKKKNLKTKELYLTLYWMFSFLLHWVSSKEKVFEEFAYRFPGGWEGSWECVCACVY